MTEPGSYNGNNSAKKRIIIAMAVISIAVVAGIVASQMLQYEPPPATSQSDVIKIERQRETDYFDFNFRICGDEIDPAKVPGTPENPAVISKNGSSTITIPFCVSTVGDTSKVLILGQESADGSPTVTKVAAGELTMGEPIMGINVSMEKNSLNIPAKKAAAGSGSQDNTSYDSFKIFLSADPTAELGTHKFSITAFHPDETGVSGLIMTQYVYVRIVN